METYLAIDSEYPEIPMLKGIWNGNIEIYFRSVEYIVGKPESNTWWSANHVGETRQAILVINPKDNHKFLIDNKYGDGFQRVIRAGTPWAYHKSVDNPTITKQELPFNEWNTVLDIDSLKKEQSIHDANFKRKDPIAQERIEELRRIHEPKK